MLWHFKTHLLPYPICRQIYIYLLYYIHVLPLPRRSIVFSIRIYDPCTYIVLSYLKSQLEGGSIKIDVEKQGLLYNVRNPNWSSLIDYTHTSTQTHTSTPNPKSGFNVVNEECQDLGKDEKNESDEELHWRQQFSSDFVKYTSSSKPNLFFSLLF